MELQVQNEGYKFIVVYIAISIIWIILSLLIIVTFNRSLFWIIVYIIITIIYIPLALYYVQHGESYRIYQAIVFSVALLIIYIFIESIIALVFFIQTGPLV